MDRHMKRNPTSRVSVERIGSQVTFIAWENILLIPSDVDSV
jgi:hypothetical protein